MVSAVSFIDDTTEKNYGSIPHEFICPLTMEIMIHPVMDRYGRSYERSAIAEWITTQNATCPITRQLLHIKNLYPNNKLRKEIARWREEQGDDITLDSSMDENTIIEEEFIRAI
jgi:U-box domain